VIATVSEAEREQFRRDGVVALRDRFDPDWLETLSGTIDEALRSPGPNLVNHSKTSGAPAYYEDFWSWNRYPGFRRFVHESPCAAIAAELLGARRINLVMDNWFLREAGSQSRPPFHHDISYFDFDGTMCVLWLPLEPVSADNGIAFVKGSHLWDKLFLRVRFADGHRVDGEACEVNGECYEPPPDVAADPGRYDLVRFDLDLGDCIYFDMRTLHGALSTLDPTETVRRYTLRMSAEDGRIRYRGDWARAEREIFEAAGYGEGDALDGSFFPRLWPPDRDAPVAPTSATTAFRPSRRRPCRRSG